MRVLSDMRSRIVTCIGSYIHIRHDRQPLLFTCKSNRIGITSKVTCQIMNDRRKTCGSWPGFMVVLITGNYQKTQNLLWDMRRRNSIDFHTLTVSRHISMYIMLSHSMTEYQDRKHWYDNDLYCLGQNGNKSCLYIVITLKKVTNFTFVLNKIILKTRSIRAWNKK